MQTLSAFSQPAVSTPAALTDNQLCGLASMETNSRATWSDDPGLIETGSSNVSYQPGDHSLWTAVPVFSDKAREAGAKLPDMVRLSVFIAANSVIVGRTALLGTGDGSPIKVGTYLNAGEGYNFVGPVVVLNGRCNEVRGSFTITQINIVPVSACPTGFRVQRLVATHESYCTTNPSAHERASIDFTANDDGTGTGGGGDSGGGTTPPPPPVTPPDIQMYMAAPQPLAMANGQSMPTPMHFYSLTGFTSALSLSAWSDSPENNDFHVSITPDSIASPGEGDATLTIDVGPMALPRDYIVTVAATTNEQTPRTFFATYLVTLNCDPPMILGLDQPKNQSVTRGTAATLSVKATGSGPFAYQWYNGWTGMTWSPVSGATKNTFTTPVVNDTNTYWVRISNACGSADSNPVTVSPK